MSSSAPKKIFACILLASAMIASFAFPRSKYEGSRIIDTLSIPTEFNGWKSADISKEFDFQDPIYNFVSSAFARDYTDPAGRVLTLYVLDANNFHHPQTCFSNSGYTVTPEKDLELTLGLNRFKARVLYAQSPKDNMLVVYWICINKEQTDWTHQKIKQLFYSILGRNKASLMGRLDIHCQPSELPQITSWAGSFLEQVAQNMPADQREYLFGKS